LLENDADVLKSDVLVAPHHGSKTSSSTDFISAVQPKHTIFTAGYLNRFKHPVPKVLERYRDSGSAIYRSDYHGAIMIETNSKLGKDHKMRISNWRHENKHYWHDDFE
jgi:competence protein ComEC